MLGNLAQVDIVSERHGAGMDSKNLQPRLIVGNTDFNLTIEAARTPQRRIKNLRNIGRADHDDLATRHKSVHQAEKLRDPTLFPLAGHLGALRGDGVDLVDKEDRGSVPRSFFEDLAKLGLALSVKLPHDFGAVEVYEVHAALSRDGARQQRLASTRRTIQQHALRRENSQPLEDTRIFQWQLNDFAN